MDEISNYIIDHTNNLQWNYAARLLMLLPGTLYSILSVLSKSSFQMDE